MHSLLFAFAIYTTQSVRPCFQCSLPVPLLRPPRPPVQTQMSFPEGNFPTRRLTFGLHKSKAVRVFHFYHGFDWLCAIILLIIVGIIYKVDISPYHREFALSDTSIAHSMKKDTISLTLCGILAELIPLGVIIVGSLLLQEDKGRYHLLHVSVLGLVMSCAVNQVITNVVKNWIGRPRPDFLSRCIPDVAGITSTDNVSIYEKMYNATICSQTDQSLINEGYRSCPSGHSSTAFQGFFYLTIWLCGQLLTFGPGVEYFRLVIAALPTGAALYIAITRTENYKHHVTDVIAGALLGTLVSWLTYRKFFPSIFSKRCYAAYDPPSYDTYNEVPEFENEISGHDFLSRRTTRQADDIEMSIQSTQRTDRAYYSRPSSNRT